MGERIPTEIEVRMNAYQKEQLKNIQTNMRSLSKKLGYLEGEEQEMQQGFIGITHIDRNHRNYRNEMVA